MPWIPVQAVPEVGPRDEGFMTTETNFWKVCNELYGDQESYYHRWYHEKPLVITPERNEELREMHRVLYKCVEYMAANYAEFTDKYMPLSEKEMEILEYQSEYPFLAGTFRPDYLITDDGELKLCEITSRFFGHGIFMSYFAEAAANKFMEKHPGCHRESLFEQMMQSALEIVGDKDEIFVLKSSDKTSEIKLYKPFYEHFGKKVTILEANEVEPRINDWNGKFVISALNQMDILSYSMDTIKAMIDSRMYNDFRTVFLIHDKRFMQLWYTPEFTQKFLTEKEAEFLRAHAIETYICKDKSSAGILEKAYANKDAYILKHFRLGKSEKVYAGPLTSESDWKALFDGGVVKDMIIQPFLHQKTYRTVWEGTPFDDYVCGMMLCIDDKYFDSGLFRTSSCPVTNVVDDRKAFPIVTENESIISCGDVL